MANLYQIRREIEDFEYEVDEETGELLNVLAWDELNMSFEEKVENIACYIKNLASDVLDFKTEEDQLAKRRRSKEKKIEYLKRLLTDNLNGQQFSTAKCAVSFRRSEQVEITDENAIPRYLIDEVVTLKPDKRAIKELLKAGSGVGGCRLVENQNIQIK